MVCSLPEHMGYGPEGSEFSDSTEPHTITMDQWATSKHLHQLQDHWLGNHTNACACKTLTPACCSPTVLCSLGHLVTLTTGCRATLSKNVFYRGEDTLKGRRVEEGTFRCRWWGQLWTCKSCAHPSRADGEEVCPVNCGVWFSSPTNP